MQPFPQFPFHYVFSCYDWSGFNAKVDLITFLIITEPSLGKQTLEKTAAGWRQHFSGVLSKWWPRSALLWWSLCVFFFFFLMASLFFLEVCMYGGFWWPRAKLKKHRQQVARAGTCWPNKRQEGLTHRKEMMDADRHRRRHIYSVFFFLFKIQRIHLLMWCNYIKKLQVCLMYAPHHSGRWWCYRHTDKVWDEMFYLEPLENVLSSTTLTLLIWCL